MCADLPVYFLILRIHRMLPLKIGIENLSNPSNLYATHASTQLYTIICAIVLPLSVDCYCLEQQNIEHGWIKTVERIEVNGTE